MSYITVADLELYTGEDYTTAQESFITNTLIPAVESIINAYTGRVFGVGADSDTTKYYLGSSRSRYDYDPLGRGNMAFARGDELEIDDFVSITSLTEIDSNGTEHVLDLDNFEMLPIEGGYINRIYAKAGSFAGYKYKIVGKLGSYATVPADIKLAALQIATDALAAAESSLQSESIEGWSYTRGGTLFGANAIPQVILGNPMVATMLSKWRKITI